MHNKSIQDGTIKILSSGSSTQPVSLEEVDFHLREGDKQSWTIIRNNLLVAPEAEVHRILEQVTQTEGVLFSTHELVGMLLSLPGGDNIQGLLTYRANH